MLDYFKRKNTHKYKAQPITTNKGKQKSNKKMLWKAYTLKTK